MLAALKVLTTMKKFDIDTVSDQVKVNLELLKTLRQSVIFSYKFSVDLAKV